MLPVTPNRPLEHFRECVARAAAEMRNAVEACNNLDSAPLAVIDADLERDIEHLSVRLDTTTRQIAAIVVAMEKVMRRVQPHSGNGSAPLHAVVHK